VELALQVAVPAPDGVKRPVEEMVPPVAVQVTAELNVPVPDTVAAHCDVCPVLMDVGAAETEMDVMVKGTAVTLIEAEPEMLEYPVCVEVAVQVPVPVAEGVKTPACVMVPPVADHVTPVLLFPLPDTVAVQVDVWPRSIEAGVATTETELIWLPWPFTFKEPEPDFMLSCLDVAVIVSRPDDGAESGAVYKPELVAVPIAAVHVTSEL